MAKKNTGSESFKMNKEDGKKVVKGAIIALAGAVLSILVDVIPGVDFGKYQGLAAAVGAIAANALRIWIANNK